MKSALHVLTPTNVPVSLTLQTFCGDTLELWALPGLHLVASLPLHRDAARVDAGAKRADRTNVGTRRPDSHDCRKRERMVMDHDSPN